MGKKRYVSRCACGEVAMRYREPHHGGLHFSEGRCPSCQTMRVFHLVFPPDTPRNRAKASLYERGHRTY